MHAVISLLALVALAVSAVPAHAADSAATDEAQWGLRKENPVEVCQPIGQHAYLARLVCSDQSRPRFERGGSVGNRNPPSSDRAVREREFEAMMTFAPLAEGATDYHVIDRYDVQCGETTTAVYMDMYHCPAAPVQRAPAGFTLQD
ncbi:TPA: hypothetical protein QDZ34_000538 [Stenotrophomonas maltophilia]|nr:hypothetical protein [Stenotrophomonas maltophilia]HDS1025845.1 hypothetical protein [Stenotrophomonas maltophilia]HDS1029990.1 hypothetical protein [Stenotrophomonas maltophilia]HDS1033229.1 hypothetical protein [Stenotrophomonas maltophilia]